MIPELLATIGTHERAAWASYEGLLKPGAKTTSEMSADARGRWQAIHELMVRAIELALIPSNSTELEREIA